MKETVGDGVNVAFGMAVGVLGAGGGSVSVAVAVMVGVSVGACVGVSGAVGVGEATGVAVGVGGGVGVGPGGGNCASARPLRLTASNNPIPHPRRFRLVLRISFLTTFMTEALRCAISLGAGDRRRRPQSPRNFSPKVMSERLEAPLPIGSQANYSTNVTIPIMRALGPLAF